MMENEEGKAVLWLTFLTHACLQTAWSDSLVILPPSSPLGSTLNFYLKAAFNVNMIAVEKILWRFCTPFT